MRLYVCRPATFYRRRVAYCPTCRRRRRFVWAEQVWYGVRLTCCGCGDSWNDGQREPRPFRRGWRKGAVRLARERWAQIPPYDREEHRAWLAEQLGDPLVTA